MIVITDNEKYKAEIDVLAEAVTKHFKLPKKSYVELDFVDAEEIREINRENRDVDKVTDILSFPNLDGIFGKQVKLKDFPYDIDYETGMLNIGSLVVCIDKILEQAIEYGTGERREFTYLLTHGLLHLLGYDHMIDEDKVVMRAKEEEILRLINA